MGGFVQLPVLAMVGMGIAMAVSSSIRWVYGDNQVVDMDDDSRISDLPDDILNNIVSRLQDIEAQRTSILSRRWRKIWIMNLKTEFLCISICSSNYLYRALRSDHHIDNNKKLRFLKAVDQRLKLYSSSGSQKKLKFFWMRCCFLCECTSHLKKWIHSLEKLGVESLSLGSFNCCHLGSFNKSFEKFTFSFNLISRISTLRWLGLYGCNIDIGGPCQQIFNSLLTINLDLVPLLKGEISSLLLSCPNLKNLFMFDCQLPSSLNISGGKLETLRLRNCINLSELNIHAALNLVELYISQPSMDLLLTSVPKLELLCFETSGKHKQPYPFVAVVPSSCQLPRLHCLCIHTHINEMPWITLSFNMFSNLRKLYMVMNSLRVLDLGNITPVLSFCPLLKVFYVEMTKGDGWTHSSFKDSLPDVDPDPDDTYLDGLCTQACPIVRDDSST